MKVRSRKVTYDGIEFDSFHEGEVYRSQLKPLFRNKKITQLQCHPKFTFFVDGVRVGSYKPDFTFVDAAGLFGEPGLLRCWDAKGFKASPKTGKLLPRVEQGFGKTKRLMLACFAITVECV